MESFFVWILESSLLVTMILGIRWAFMGRVRYAGIYALWLVVLLRFLIPVNVISVPFSVGNVISQTVSSWKQAELSRQDDGSAGSPGQNIQQQTEIGKLVEVDAAGLVSGELLQKEAARTEENQLSNQGTVVAQTNPFYELISSVNWRRVLVCGWAVISGLLLLWFVLSNLLLTRRLKENRVLYGTRDKIKIYAVSGLKNPCLYGLFRPVIYIPRALVMGKAGRRADSEELEQIIAHEYVHYRHKDHIWAALRMLLVSVYWFHPFMWLAVSCSKKDAELFCDETVIGMLGEEKRFTYGEMLVRFAGDARWGDFRYSMMPMSRKGKEMERRIRAISSRKRYSKWVLLPLLLVVSVAASITCSTGVGPLAKGRKTADQAQKSREKKERSENKGEGKEEEEGKNSTEGAEEQLAMYSDFLRAGATDTEERYYSLAWLEDDHVALLISSEVSEINGEYWGSSSCEMYNIAEGKVVSCGNIAGDSDNWIRLSQGKILTQNTGQGITKSWVALGSEELLTETVTEGEHSSSDTSSEYQTLLNKFEQVSGIAFYTNPYVEKKPGQVEPKIMALQNNGAAYLSHDVQDNQALAYSGSYEAAFQHYIEIFTEAVNTGNTEKMSQVLAEGSEVYKQQCALVKNYYKRGIREEVKACAISSVKYISSVQVEICSKEKIKVYFWDTASEIAKSTFKAGESASESGGATSKLVRQQYRYTCENIKGSWIITGMDEIS